MSLDIDADILEEEFFESIESTLERKTLNVLRTECDEEPLTKESSIGV